MHLQNVFRSGTEDSSVRAILQTLVLVDLNQPYTASKENILYKCGWSPLEGFTFPATIAMTFVNGYPVYENGRVDASYTGMRLQFNRN